MVTAHPPEPWESQGLHAILTRRKHLCPDLTSAVTPQGSSDEAALPVLSNPAESFKVLWLNNDSSGLIPLYSDTRSHWALEDTAGGVSRHLLLPWTWEQMGGAQKTLPSPTTDLKGDPHPNPGGQTWGKVQVPVWGEPIRNVATCVIFTITLGLKTFKVIKLGERLKREALGVAFPETLVLRLNGATKPHKVLTQGACGPCPEYLTQDTR